jgi:purine nucleoside phosphorylase
MGPLDEHLDNPCTTATDIMLEIYSQIEEAAAVIGSRWPGRPRVGIILGTGLSTVTNMCLPDALGETSGDDVVRIAKSAESKLRSILVGVLDEELDG